MYQKYHTEAIVLGSGESAEADKTLTLLTREFGLVRARARAMRLERSKMRCALQNYSRAQIALIRGKAGWRVAGAALLSHAGADIRALCAFARIAELATRLIAGEEENAYLFETLAGAHTALIENGRPESPSQSIDVARGKPATIELLCVARLLYALGYLSPESFASRQSSEEGGLFDSAEYGEAHLRAAKALERPLLSAVNRAIAQTDL